MGKRKKSSRKPTGPKKREPLPTSFRCVFCNNETSVSVKIDKKAGIGSLTCKSCGQNFQVPANALAQPVDIYAEWIDACEEVAKEEASARPVVAAPPPVRQRHADTAARVGLAPGEKFTDEDRNFIDDDDEDAEADFADED